MIRSYTITLDDLELGQIVDGLERHAELWDHTRDYLETGEVDVHDAIGIAECSKLEEAEAIASKYRSILTKIQEQMGKQ